jgi:hypothetical protein
VAEWLATVDIRYQVPIRVLARVQYMYMYLKVAMIVYGCDEVTEVASYELTYV